MFSGSLSYQTLLWTSRPQIQLNLSYMTPTPSQLNITSPIFKHIFFSFFPTPNHANPTSQSCPDNHSYVFALHYIFPSSISLVINSSISLLCHHHENMTSTHLKPFSSSLTFSTLTMVKSACTERRLRKPGIELPQPLSDSNLRCFSKHSGLPPTRVGGALPPGNTLLG